jgi:hypothetical protein
LKNYVDATEDKSVRHNSYFILGFNARNSKELNATRFLLSKLTKEKDRAILVVILDRLAELHKPRNFDLSPIFKLTKKGIGGYVVMLLKL